MVIENLGYTTRLHSINEKTKTKKKRFSLKIVITHLNLNAFDYTVNIFYAAEV
jgi:hypothetical protein